MDKDVKESVVEYISWYAEVQPDAPAIIVGETVTTYRQLWAYIKSFATFLRNRGGVSRGKVVAAKASQSLEYAVCYFSTHLAGGIFAPTEHFVTDDNFRNIVESTDACVAVTNPGDVYNGLKCMPFDMSQVMKICTEYQAAEDIAESFPQSADSADLLFTTGTTGDSKGAELSHRALVATAENLIAGCEMKKDTQILVPGPLNHANPIRKLYTAMVNGSSIIILNGMMNVKAFFDALDHSVGSTACCLPPAAIRTIFQITGDKLQEYADKIDFIEYASSPLPEPDKLRLCRLLPHTRLYNNYGSSEAASVCMYDYNRHPGKVHCVGKAMPNSEIIIVDDEKRPISSSAEHLGLLACIGDVNMKGYWKDPQLTAQVLQDGIVYTNDIGYMDSDGFIYVIGRKGDVINVGGLKVSPSEVEAAALSHTDISECVCVPVPDSVTGQAIKLLVVLNSGAELHARELRQYLSRSLEGYKLPKYIEQTDEIPKTYNGKIDRKKIIASM